jgi:ketosteroid isomerase-like protein
MSQQTPGRAFYEEQIAALETQDIERLMAQYAEDAVLVTFDATVSGVTALREYFVGYLARLGSMKLLSTDRFTETPDSIYFEATIRTSLVEARVYDVFMLSDGKATHQFAGVLSRSPLASPS